jgi:hypothetical protein
MRLRPSLSVLFLALGVAASAQEAAKPIQDNSFLLEEAYNQEPGVVQHISNFTRYQQSKDWLYTFTQEWPVGGLQHQFSYTLPLAGMQASRDGGRGVGDILLNYRYQLVGDGDARIAVAPRLSLVLPTGDYRQLRGTGAVGYQFNLPVSAVLSDAFVTHWNLGATYTPGARDLQGAKADTSSWLFGQSLVWLASPGMNALVEFVFNSGEVVTGPGRKERVDSFYINPGLRWAINFKSGLQIVPGIAVPIGVGPSRGERAIFLYLSFEAPMWAVKK